MTAELETLLEALRKDYPTFTFIEGGSFYWSPKKQEIRYNHRSKASTAPFALLHEVGHALLAHNHYSSDFELLIMEVAAWEEAKRIAPMYSLAINEDHIQDCLDSYRDWIFRRSACPSCSTASLQQDDQPQYRCHNCHAVWRVTASRFCRPYRQTTESDKTIVLLP